MERLDSAENIEKIKALVGELKITGYKQARPEQKAQVEKTLDFLYAGRSQPETRQKLMSLLEFMSQPLPGRELPQTEFDLHAHLRGLSALIENKEGAEFYCRLQKEDEPISRGLNVKDLWSSVKPLPKETTADKIKKAEEIFDRLCRADGKVNGRLAELARECPVSFEIMNDKSKDGECRIINDENGRRSVIALNEGTFDDETILPMLMAHELGHYIDGAGRPADFRGHLPRGQEYTADILGAEMALNAGYKTSNYGRMIKNTGNPFLQDRAQRLEEFTELYQKADLQRRLETIPNTPAGRKVCAFISETDAFFDRWKQDKKQADSLYEAMSKEERMSAVFAAMGKRIKECAGLSDEEKLQKFNEKAEEYRQAEKKLTGREMTVEEARESYVENIVKSELYFRLAVSRINARFNPQFDPSLNKGYCTASLMQCLRKADKNGELDVIFNTDPERLAHPATLFKHLQETEGGRYAGNIRASGDDGCKGVQDIIDKYDIKPGALVCLTIDCKDKAELREDGRNHLMLYVGKDRNGEQCFYGFNNDIKDGKLRNKNIGFVCDSCRMFEEMIRDHHRVYVRGGYIETTEQGIKTEPNASAATEKSPRFGHNRGGR